MVGEHEVFVAEVASGAGHLEDGTAAVGPVGVAVAVAAQRRSEGLGRGVALGDGRLRPFSFKALEVGGHLAGDRFLYDALGLLTDGGEVTQPALGLQPRQLAGRQVAQGHRRLAERLTVDLDHGLAEFAQLVRYLLFRSANLIRCFGGGLHQNLIEHLLVVIRQFRPDVRADNGEQRFDDVAGQHDVALHLVEFLGHDGRQRILLAIDGALLQGEVHFGESDWRGVGADRLRQHQIERRRRHAQLHALHILGLLDFLVGGHHALAVIGERDNLVLGLVLVALGDVAEQFAVAVGLPVIEVAQHEWRPGDGQRLVDRAGE